MKNNDKYNYDLKNIANWRKEFNREVLEKTREAQQKYNFDMGPDNNSTHNNEADAVKHALMQAILTYRSGGSESLAKIIGDYHELEGNWSKQPIQEKNMDLWNNQIGRDLAHEVLKDLKSKHLGEPKNQQEFEEEFLKRLYEKMQNGELITKPFEDTRSYKDLQKGKPTGQASNIDNIREFTPPYTRGDIKSMTPEEFQYYEKSIMQEVKQGNILDDPRVKSTFAPEQKEIIFEENPDTDIKIYSNKHIYTREEIGKMSTYEYAKHEPAILKQMKEKGIPTKRELEEHRSKTSGKSSNGSNADGRWVTINGNHVLIND